LTHERIEWSKHLGEEGLLNVDQRRFCFTYIKPKELNKHCKKFGIYSLQFNPQSVRCLGALPAFYIPSVKSPHSEIKPPSQLLVKRLLNAYSLLNNIGGESILGVMGILGLLCPTEYKDQMSLENFQLREWRLIGNTLRHSEKREHLVIDLSDDDFKKLAEINRKLDGRNKKRQEKCLKLHKFDGKHILSYADYLITPDDSGIVRESMEIIESLKEKKKPKVISKSEFNKIHRI